MCLIQHISQSIAKMIDSKMLACRQCLIHLWCRPLVRELFDIKVYQFRVLPRVNLQSLNLQHQMLTFILQTILKQHLTRFILIYCNLVIIWLITKSLFKELLIQLRNKMQSNKLYWQYWWSLKWKVQLEVTMMLFWWNCEVSWDLL